MKAEPDPNDYPEPPVDPTERAYSIPVTESPELVIRPHPGAQEAFMGSAADIVIGGGQAGGGKTAALLMEPLRHTHVPGFNAVVFRRTSPQLTAAGGPWQESMAIYGATGGYPANMAWRWRTGEGTRPATVQFRHLQHEKDRLAWKGAQIALILFDQLEDFLENQFWYLWSRNRSTCGVRPYIRATCNPVPEDDPVGGWLRKLVGWWIDPDTGYALPERSGVTRWFVRQGEDLVWGNSRAELRAQFPGVEGKPGPKPVSLAFVPMALEDNPTMALRDPDYEAKLDALPYVDRMRLRHGNWNVRAVAGLIFSRGWFQVCAPEDVPATARHLRFWDIAATQGGGKFTAGVRVAFDDTRRRVFIVDVRRAQLSPGNVDRLMEAVSASDGLRVPIREEQEPGSSGKTVIEARKAKLTWKGYQYEGVRPALDGKPADKLSRWKPLAAQAELGNVYLVKGPWNEAFLAEAERAHPDAQYLDQVDAAAGGFLELAAHPGLGSQGGKVKLQGW